MDNLSVEELALQRKRYAHLSDEQWRFMLQQIDGRQRTQDKLPTFALMDDWWYPVRLSCEQCSSEVAARYKAQLIAQYFPSEQSMTGVITDLTGGYGVDIYFMSEHANQAHYVERNEELCRIATHNFRHTRPQLKIHHTDALSFLNQMSPSDVIYIDPARRDQHGGKVFRLEDCEPNVIDILPLLSAKSKLLMIKLSPMLDITQALHSLSGQWDVHIVAIKNEVKEVLLLSKTDNTTPMIHAVNITPSNTYSFTFTQEEEKHAQLPPYSPLISPYIYIYEPNVAILKAGAYKLVAQRYGLTKMAQHTHLYFSEQLIENFPGRIWQIIDINPKQLRDIRANILTRNYPITPDQLRKKSKIKDSDTHTLIGARLGDKPTLFLCKKI